MGFSIYLFFFDTNIHLPIPSLRASGWSRPTEVPDLLLADALHSLPPRDKHRLAVKSGVPQTAYTTLTSLGRRSILVHIVVALMSGVFM